MRSTSENQLLKFNRSELRLEADGVVILHLSVLIPVNLNEMHKINTWKFFYDETFLKSMTSSPNSYK